MFATRVRVCRAFFVVSSFFGMEVPRVRVLTRPIPPPFSLPQVCRLGEGKGEEGAWDCFRSIDYEGLGVD